VAVGNIPGAIALNPVTNRIYVVNYDLNGTVTVIDGATNATTTVPVGISPRGIAVNPVTNKIYVANYGPEPPYRSPDPRPDYTVTVIDGATNATATVIVENRPLAVAVNPVTNKVYVANFGDMDPAGGRILGHTVSVIDGVTNATTTVGVGIHPTGIAVNPVTNKVYVSNYDDRTETVIDGATHATVTLPLGESSQRVAVNSVTNKVYVTGSSTMTVIDGATNALAALPVEPNQWEIAVNPLANKIYLTHLDSPKLTVIDGSTNTVASLDVGSGSGIVANPVTNRVYVANGGLSGSPGNTVTVIDGAVNLVKALGPYAGPPVVNPVTNKLYVSGPGKVTVLDVSANTATTVNVGTNPGKPQVNPVTNKIYVANSDSDTVTVIDGTTNATVTVPVGSYPMDPAVNPVTNKIYIPNMGSYPTPGNTLTVLDGATLATSSIPVGSGPKLAAVNPATNKIYVASAYPPTLTIIDGASLTTTSVSLMGPINHETAEPLAMAVNMVSNKIYVTDGDGMTLFVVDGATNAVTRIGVDKYVWAVAVNPITNRVYVGGVYGGFIQVFDGATNTQLAMIPVGTAPHEIAVNPVTNRIYIIVNGNPDTVTVLDGATNGIQTVPVGSNPFAFAVNPVTNQVYIPDYAGTLWALDVDGVQPSPMAIAASGVTDGQTVANSNLFATTNPSPSFKATVTSAYSDSVAYGGVGGLSDPPPTALNYWVDDGAATTWKLASRINAPDTNPADFSLTLSPESLGVHTLYFFAAYGEEGGSVSGRSPGISHLQALPFVILPAPLATCVSLTPSVCGPYTMGEAVTFTAAGRGSSGYQYRFYLFHRGIRTLVQDYSPVATWPLPADLTPGTYKLEVWVRTPNSTQAKDASADRTFTLRLAPATGVSLTPSIPGPFVKGTAVTFTATGQGSSHYEYAFFLQVGSTWKLVQAFSNSATYVLPKHLPVGNHALAVEVCAGAKGPGQARKDFPFMIVNKPRH
jgi:YVTN family beta-propeller protein